MVIKSDLIIESDLTSIEKVKNYLTENVIGISEFSVSKEMLIKESGAGDDSYDVFKRM